MTICMKYRVCNLQSLQFTKNFEWMLKLDDIRPEDIKLERERSN